MAEQGGGKLASVEHGPHNERPRKNAYFNLKWVIFDPQLNRRFQKIFFSEWQQKTVPVPVVSFASMSYLINEWI